MEAIAQPITHRNVIWLRSDSIAPKCELNYMVQQWSKHAYIRLIAMGTRSTRYVPHTYRANKRMIREQKFPCSIKMRNSHIPSRNEQKPSEPKCNKDDEAERDERNAYDPPLDRSHTWAAF